MAAATILDALSPRLSQLNLRLSRWQEQIRDEFRKVYDSGKLTAESGMAEQQEALRLAMARTGEGPRRELNQAIDELCQLYLAGSSDQREDIRQLLGDNPAVLDDLWGYIARAAEQVRAGGGGVEWLRAGLAVAAMEDLRADHHDTLHGLGELYVAASQAGLDPQKHFADVAKLCSSEVEGGNSTRDLLLNFSQSEFFMQQVKPQL